MHKWTPESRAKLSASLRGRTVPQDVRAKISANHARHFLGKKMSPEACQKMSASMKGRVPWNKGRKIGPFVISAETRQRARDRMRRLRTGDKNPMWRGGVTPLRTRLWRSDKYRRWRETIFARDGHACVQCGKASGCGVTVRLEADHYPVPFVVLLDAVIAAAGKSDPFIAALNSSVLWSADGRTLCRSCHNKTKRGKYTTQEFLKAKQDEYQMARHQ